MVYSIGFLNPGFGQAKPSCYADFLRLFLNLLPFGNSTTLSQQFIVLLYFTFLVLWTFFSSLPFHSLHVVFLQ